ncbi:MAG: Gfo/Idh/MocA family oxidoreductase [Candidatus Tectomicrobia bacterium]|uniref:Gfo/Idh/MocA family oxidoreductase n=1 Tax=Tectimicrobiota bacterium TaxID=2528274 RepID=A0A932MN62_UNCTE|nr:Gfo/Idh/MocA family oxidoreductase [Candidatus Tectomicrobia bacterium]
MKRIGVGIVGAGRIGRLRAYLAANSPEVRFLALADQDPARAALIAKETGAQFHSGDSEAVLSHPEVDAVIVSTPEFAHADPVCRALELGKPVLCEKPIALSLADADRILEARRRRRGTLFIGYTQRLRRRFLNAKEQIRQGRLGRLQTARATLYNIRSNGAEIYKRAPHAGPVTDTLTYMVDIALWYFEGRTPARVYAQGGSQIFPHHPMGCGDWAWALLSFKEGGTVSLGCSWILPDNWPAHITSIDLEVLGSEGAIAIDDSHRSGILATSKGVPSPYVPGGSSNVVFLESMMAGDWLVGDFWGPMRDETRLFLEHVTRGRAVPLTTPEEARATLEVTLAIERSAKENRPIELPLG